MKSFSRDNLYLSLCGLNCGLCTMRIGGHCHGCGCGEQHSCAIARCSVTQGKVDYCYACGLDQDALIELPVYQEGEKSIINQDITLYERPDIASEKITTISRGKSVDLTTLVDDQWACVCLSVNSKYYSGYILRNAIK